VETAPRIRLASLCEAVQRLRGWQRVRDVPPGQDTPAPEADVAALGEILGRTGSAMAVERDV